MRTLSLLAIVVLGCSSSGSEGEGAVDAGDETAAEVDSGTNIGDSGSDDSGDPADSAPSDAPGDVADDTASPPADTAPPPACSKPAMSGVSNGSITVNGTARTYVLSIPAGYGDKPLPLVFAWHGRTGNGANFRSYAGVEKAAAGAAIFVYPNGLPVTSDPKDTGWQLGATGRDVALFDALVKELSAKYCINDKRIYSFGYSFGGYMSNALGCHRSAVLRAIAPYAGGGPSGACGGAVAAWIGHAADDSVVNISEGQKSRDFWRGKNGCAMTTKPATPSQCASYDGCTAPLHWCTTTSGGHAYPSYAGAAIWSFFSALD